MGQNINKNVNTNNNVNTNRRWKPWEPWEDEFMRSWYGKMPREKIARHLGRTVPSLNSRALKLGLRNKKPPRWTPEEEEFLRKNWRRMSISKIAKALGRSWHSIEVKAGPGRLNLGPQTDPKKWTAQGIADLLDIDVHVVLHWLKKRWLRANLSPCEKRKIYQVTTRALLRFLRENPDKWNSNRCPDLLYEIEIRLNKKPGKRHKNRQRIPEHLKNNFAKFVVSVAQDMLLERSEGCNGGDGDDEYYGWLDEKIIADQKLPERRFKRWTPEEDLQLARMFRHGDKTYAEMGKVLGRSGGAVGHRLRRINVWELLERELIVV